MNWIWRYKISHYAQNSTWIVPVIGIVGAIVTAKVLSVIDGRVGLQSSIGMEGARTLLASLSGAMFTFLVFICSTLLLVVQVAGAQLTPRIVALMFRDGVTRFSLTLFTFAFTFSLSVLLRLHVTVAVISTHTAVYLCLLSIGFFMVLIDHVGKSLRPSGALRTVAREGHDVIRSVYPRPVSETRDAAPADTLAPGEEAQFVVPNPTDGVLLAFDFEGLVALAQRANCVIELVPQVGDFVSADSPLFRLYRCERRPSYRALCQSVALGQERTMEQDPVFAFRIIVDIASKALSPAINDPTTAVLAIDQLHHLLRNVGNRHLDEGMAHDRTGALRLVYRTPDWEDFVCLAVTEIRQFGRASIQVARRLRAMLENLTEVLPPERAALLRGELKVVQRSVERFFPEPEDQALAHVSDLQGVGGNPAGDNASV